MTTIIARLWNQEKLFINPEQMRKHGNACSRAHPPDVLKPVSLVSSAFRKKQKKRKEFEDLFYTAHVEF